MGDLYVFTGNGKGKTTAGLGVVLQKAAQGKGVEIIQFQKGTGFSGELLSFHKLFPQVSIVSFGWGCSISSLIRSGQAKCSGCGDCFRKNRDPATTMAPQALAYTQERFAAGEAQVFLLDEISHAIKNRLIPLEKVLDLLVARGTRDVILTGRDMPREIIAMADYAASMTPERHPFELGVASRRGIEY